MNMSEAKHYRLYADGVTAIHFLWTVVVFGGALLMLFWHPYALYEIFVVSFTLLVSLPFGGLCPLTMMEERFRKKIDPSFTNEGSYMAHYINKIFGADFGTRTVNTGIGIFYTIIYAVAIYIMVKG